MNGKYFLWWAGRTLPYVAVYLVLAVGIATLTLALLNPSSLATSTDRAYPLRSVSIRMASR